MICQHDWKEEYYGVECKKCGTFYPHGSAPWEWTPEDDYRAMQEEYQHTSGTCSTCGGEHWDGGSSCTCYLWDSNFVTESKEYVLYDQMGWQDRLGFWLMFPVKAAWGFVLWRKYVKDDFHISIPPYVYAVQSVWTHPFERDQ